MKKFWKVIGGIAIVAGIVAVVAKIMKKYRECECFQDEECDGCCCGNGEYYFEEGEGCCQDGCCEGAEEADADADDEEFQPQ